MRYGVCTTMDRYGDLCALGYDYIELPGTAVRRITAAQTAEAARRLKGEGRPCIGFNAYCDADLPIVGEGYRRERVYDYARDLCEKGAVLGIRSLGIGSPGARRLPAGYDRARADDQCREFLTVTASVAAEYGITVLLEALNHTMCEYLLDTAEAWAMVRQLGLDNLGLVLDFYQAAMEGEPPEKLAPVRDLSALVPADGLRRHPQRGGGQRGLPPGCGAVSGDHAPADRAGEKMRQGGRAMAVREKKVVLAGAGTMGASLAQVYAQAGWETVLWNRSASGLDRARALIALNQESFVREGLLTQEASDALLARIRMTTERDDFSDAALVVENIVEKLDAKRAFFAEISPLVPEEALLATNTSGLRISEIAEACRGPERFMGQHWLNPPHLLPLCEIIAGERTDPENVRKMRALVEGLGKRPVVVADISGFLINRLQFALLREALHIVDTGAATVEDVDTALKAGMGLRYAALGPFGVADFGGLDTFDHINSYLNAQLDDSKTGSRRLHEMVEAGKLGVKSGRGFYDYSGDRAAEAIRERDRLYIELAKVLYFKKP